MGIRRAAGLIFFSTQRIRRRVGSDTGRRESACQYVKHAVGQLEIRFDRQRAMAVLMIANDAKPLTTSDVSLLFDRFYTADRTRSTQGSGLGLSIAKSLMEKMGGSLDAELVGERLTMICVWKQQAWE